jgi:hypothetical protein
MAIGFGDQVRSFACQLVVSFCLHSLVRAGLRLSLIGPRLATVSRTARSQAAGSAGFRSDRAGLITRFLEHQADEGDEVKSSERAGIALIIPDQATETGGPGKGAFHAYPVVTHSHKF